MRWRNATSLLCVISIVLLATLTSCGGSAPASHPTSVSPGTATSTPADIAATSEPIPTLTSQEQAELQYSQLRYGAALFNPPREMQVGVAQTVTYRVQYGAEVSQPTMEANLPTEDRQVVTGTIR